MSKQDSLQIQTCILKVNIHCKCEGCQHKVKKLLQKIDGVYSVKVDAEQGKVVVAGDVDPDKLLKKLKRSGKHAEIWGGQKGVMMFNQNNPNINHQFQNLQVADNNSKKVGEDKKFQNQKGQKVGVGSGGVQGQFQNFKGIQAQDLKVPPKEHKAVKFSLPEEDFDGSDYGSDDGFEDNFGDYSEEEEEGGYGHSHPMQNKKVLPVMGNDGGPNGPTGMMNGLVMNNHKGNGGAPHGPPGMMNGPAMNNVHKGNGGGVEINYGGDLHKKHDVINLAMGTMLKGGNSYEDQNGNKGGMKMKSNVDPRGLKDNKVEKQKKKNGKSEDGGLLGRFMGFGKKSNKEESRGKLSKNGSENLYNEGKEEKKGGGKVKGHHGNNDMGKNDNDYETPDHGKSDKGSNGNENGNGNGAQMGINYPVDQMRNIPAVNSGGSGGYYQGMQMQPPSYQYQQQQQQQQANMNNGYPAAMMYNRPHPSMNNYMMPPPPMPSHPMEDPMTHTFSDENVESCSIM